MDRAVVAREVGGRRLEVVRGDLTEQAVDAIVNAANSALAHGGGVAGAIVRRGGSEIQRESLEKAPVAVGDAVVTGGGRLACRYVIHAVGPVWGEGGEEAKLRGAVSSALARAAELELVSVAMPAISTGIFGYPRREGCRVIVREVKRHLEDGGTTVQLVRLVGLDEETFSELAAALEIV